MRSPYIIITTLFIVTGAFARSNRLDPRAPDFKFIEASELTLTGKLFEDTPNPYHRIDTSRFKDFSSSENKQVRQSSGIAVAFRTDSRNIIIITDFSNISYPQNTNGISAKGYDLYIKNNGLWMYAASKAGENGQENEPLLLINNMDGSMHDCLLYLPLYSEEKSILIGVDSNSTICPSMNPFKYRIAVFGSSYTQGSSTSGPGMTYSAQLSRNTGLQLLNLGCSGNGKLQPAMAKALAESDADAYLFDCFSNGDGELYKERLFDFIETVQAAKPGVPLIFQKTIYREGRRFSFLAEQLEYKKTRIADSLMALAIKRYKDVYYIEPAAVSKDHNASVDGVHPSNYGYTLWADSIRKPLLKILGKYGIRLDKGGGQTGSMHRFERVLQKSGPALSRSTGSGVAFLEKDGSIFKDLSRDGKLDIYEDWRNSPAERAADLASKLTLEQIVGLMHYSRHSSIPARDTLSHYNGKSFDQATDKPWSLTDEQVLFLKNNFGRHMLMTAIESPEAAARWSNNLQALAEAAAWGVPVEITSNPRWYPANSDNMEFLVGNGGKISWWPKAIGFAAIGDVDLMRDFGARIGREYRALGITMAMGPQGDLATDPRWYRIEGTFGESAELSAAMCRAFAEGVESQGVHYMIRHWPGCGNGTDGCDSHYQAGKIAVYPGGNFDLQLKPFLGSGLEEGLVASVMPAYPIPDGIDTVGSGFSRTIVKELLRGKYGYDGVVCTDWNITYDLGAWEESKGKSYGTENLSQAERSLLILEADCDIIGGVQDVGPLKDACKMWEEKYGRPSLEERLRTSARRILIPMFSAGLFEDPYLNPAESESILANQENQQAGYKAQMRSVILLKNHGGVLPLSPDKKIFIAKNGKAFSNELLDNYFPCRTDKIDEADAAIAFIEWPHTGRGTNGPISLQYSDYTRDGKTVHASNIRDMEMVQDLRKSLGHRPLIVSVRAETPMVFTEVEPYADAILMEARITRQAVMEVLSGRHLPGGRLPFQLPASMETVENQKEDTAFDMDCYHDSDGNVYNFGFGL